MSQVRSRDTEPRRTARVYYQDLIDSNSLSRLVYQGALLGTCTGATLNRGTGIEKLPNAVLNKRDRDGDSRREKRKDYKIRWMDYRLDT